MVVSIAYRQRRVGFNHEIVEAFFTELLKVLNLEAVELSVILISDRAMRPINFQYRGQSKTTDILSFPQYCGSPEQIRRQITSEVRSGMPILLGDLAISVETVWQRNEGDLQMFRQDFFETALHGVLHLIGYDHETDEEHRVMESKHHDLVERMGGFIREVGKELVR